MSKFAVGEDALYVGPPDKGAEPSDVGKRVRIEAVGFGPHQEGCKRSYQRGYGDEQAYSIDWLDGYLGIVAESELRKLPPDADHIPPAVRSIFNVTPNQGLPVGPRPKEKAVGR